MASDGVRGTDDELLNRDAAAYDPAEVIQEPATNVTAADPSTNSHAIDRLLCNSQTT